MYSVDESVTRLQRQVKNFPADVMILGSGWNEILKTVKIEVEIPYSELFGVSASVPGHEGKLVIARTGSKKTATRFACMSGRFHTYEGYSTEEVTRPIQTFARRGARRVIVTSAAGALNEKYRVGDFVILSDLICTFCQSPLTGPQFVDMSSVFDQEWRQHATQICATSDIQFHEGIYVYTRGPHFETPADKMFLHSTGADVVGMSTVPETIMARSLGLSVLGLSYVTNLAFVKHDHHDVLKAANAGSGRMVTLLKNVVEKRSNGRN